MTLCFKTIVVSFIEMNLFLILNILIFKIFWNNFLSEIFLIINLLC